MKCPVCTNETWKPFKGNKLLTCCHCGFVRAADKYYEPPTEHIYTASYYAGVDYYNYDAEKDSLKKNFLNRLSIIKKYIEHGDLLEVGCAYGYFLVEAKKCFKVTGLEVNAALAAKVEQDLNIKVYGGSFETTHFEGKCFDAIVALDVIEHIKDPKSFIVKCAELLKKDGYLFIETLDIGSLLPRLQGENWRLVHPPEHLSYFSYGTLSKLLTDNGFTLVESQRVWFWRSLGQIAFRLNPTFIKFMPKMLQRLNIPLNTFDLIFIVAKKL
jgi:SAM-dependent methyltransferase